MRSVQIVFDKYYFKLWLLDVANKLYTLQWWSLNGYKVI